MDLFRRYSLARHLLIAAGLLLGVIAFVVVRNWNTFALMYDNAAAMNEGRAVAEKLRHPEDLLGYIAAHPEHASLVAYDVGGREKGIFFRPAVQRPVVKTTNLLLLAEYARRVEAGDLAPGRRISLDSLATYALPGTGGGTHERALAHWREEEALRPDSTVALRHVVEALTRVGDPAAADWLMTALGRARVESLPERWGLGGSEPPLPNSGIHLSWSNHQLADTTSTSPARRYRSMSQEAYADRVYRLVRTLRRDSSFRHRERNRLRRRGTGLSVRDQRALAQVTYPEGTAADYADFLARSLDGTLGASPVPQFVRRRLETSVESDSMDVPVRALGTQVGALPGLISFVGYVRYENDRPPRVVSLLLEGLPIGVFYHLVQTSLDKGFLLRLLTDADFFQRARARLLNRARRGPLAPDSSLGEGD